MKIFVTGTRGVPTIPGGVERHCEKLYPIIAAQGHEVMLSRRSCYVDQPLTEWQGVSLVDIFAPRQKSIEAIVHTALSLILARRWGAHVLHVHAIGPALVVPLARILGMKVVVTNHGPDYDRQKWSSMAKRVLRLGEYLGCKYANEVIVVSEHIRRIVSERCGRDSNLIYNGVPVPVISTATTYLQSLGITPGRYLLAVARLVPEKGLHDLFDAFELMEGELKLVIAGDADHEDKYSAGLKQRASHNPNIIMPGYVTGDDLSQLFSHARVFVLPSYHEGLPITLLEALSYGLTVVISNIPANTEIQLNDESYFETGNVQALANCLKRAVRCEVNSIHKERIRHMVAEKYNWEYIANQTLDVYRKLAVS